jgi:predicted kinase
MPVVVILSGPSGSGKTTMRPQIMNLLGDTLILSTDDFIEGWAEEDGLSYDEALRLHGDRARVELFNQFEFALEVGVNIIWDQTNLTAEVRRKRLDRFPSKYSRIAIGFNSPTELLLKRVFDRRDETAKVVPLHLVRSQISSYEPPHFDEGFDQVLICHQPDGRLEKVA